ncbi:sugar phosphate isomerase, partial [Clostridium botulinum]|nr:sugar phosphate isomerase [Clostridium botulinum]
KRVLKRDNVYDYVIKNSENEELKALLQLYR